ncbi:DUF917 domain-containing protein [Sorangium sp. So ce1504]|uniref:DUF917 domain-containing protein n=1 Tax=Sorangium sp. So ce1504 TaxID=3133337 RepID=UPI003F5F65C9
MGFVLERKDLPDLSLGAAFLGTGGGGDPYIGRLMLERVMEEGRRVEVVHLRELGDGDHVIPTAMMGAPTCLIEKLPRGDESALSLRRLEAFLGIRATCTMPIEAGGMNSTVPLLVGAQLGLPVVDADGMGRAFPNLYQETFHVYGVPGTPMAITDEHGDTAILTTCDNFMMEWIARGITIRMGGQAHTAEYPMDGSTVRRTAIGGTLGVCLAIGKAIRQANEQHGDPFDRLVGALRETPYRYGRVLWTGKVIEVYRRTTEGFARGWVQLRDTEGSGETLDVLIQNENLVARIGTRVLCSVPDLICILDRETAEPITTEALRYGQQVKVVGVATPPILRTPEALEVFGPRAFGIDLDFVPVEELAP